MRFILILPLQKKTESPIYVKTENSETYDGYWSIKEAYDDMKSKNVKTFTIYIRRDFSQGYIEKWQNNAYVTELDKVTIDKDYSVTIKPDKTSITLNLMFDQMFKVSSGGSLTVSGNNGASLTISGKSEANTVDTGGFVLVDGGSLTILDGVTISSTKAKNGGAIYLKSGSCTLAGSASITGCAASGNGGAVYVADGTFTVQDSASIDASNDVYLEAGKVVTAEPSYDGTIGMITLPSYAEGTKVVNVKTDSSGYPGQFALNPNSKDEDGEKILILELGTPNYIVISIECNYKITIPPELIVNDDDPEYIVAEVLEVAKNTHINVIVNGDFLLDYVNPPNGVTIPSVPYTVRTDKRAVGDGDIVVSFSQNNRENVPIYAVYTGVPPAYAGDYTDKLTFTFEPVVL